MHSEPAVRGKGKRRQAALPPCLRRHCTMHTANRVCLPASSENYENLSPRRTSLRLTGQPSFLHSFSPSCHNNATVVCLFLFFFFLLPVPPLPPPQPPLAGPHSVKDYAETMHVHRFVKYYPDPDPPPPPHSRNRSS